MHSKRRCRVGGCIVAISLLAFAGRGENWPMFRGSQALLGVAKGSLAGKLNLLWSFKTGGPVKSSPAIEQNQVFFGSGDANVYALNFADGKKLWDEDWRRDRIIAARSRKSSFHRFNRYVVVCAGSKDREAFVEISDWGKDSRKIGRASC